MRLVRIVIINTIIGVLLNGCAPFVLNDFISKEKVEPGFTGIPVSIDSGSVYGAFCMTPLSNLTYTFSETNVETYKITREEIDTVIYPESETFVFTPGIVIDDAFMLLNNESQNLFLESSDTIGYAVWHVVQGDMSRNLLWLAPSVLTLFTLNILGFPAVSYTTLAGIQLDFFSSDSTKVASFIGHGKSTKYIAVWWGYQMLGGTSSTYYDPVVYRASELAALSEALRQIRMQVMADTQSLTAKIKGYRQD
jgi:hypothetical protein